MFAVISQTHIHPVSGFATETASNVSPERFSENLISVCARPVASCTTILVGLARVNVRCLQASLV